MEIQEITTVLNREKWSKFVARHKHGNIFQTPEMHQLFKNTRNYNPVLVACLDGESNVRGVLLGVIQREYSGLKGLPTSRAVIWGGPLVQDGAPEQKTAILKLLLKSFLEKVRLKTVYIQFRNLFDVKELLPTFLSYGFKWSDQLNFLVDTDNLIEVQKRISSSKLRQIRKSLNAGAEIIEAENEQQVRQFYEILRNLYISRVRKPLPDWSFFKEFFDTCKKYESGKYFLIRFKDRIIGGIMCPITRDRVIYEWYICGQDGQFKEIYPSVLATWAPIEYALKAGLKYFDFMGAGKPTQDYGVREFKSKFGGQLVNFGRLERMNNRIVYNLGKWGLKLFNQMKK